MNKRGLSHIEMIVSFVLFVSFLSFAIFFFNPFQNRGVINTALDYAADEIQESSLVELEQYSILIKSELAFVSIPSPSNIPQVGVMAEDSEGNTLASGLLGNNIAFENTPDHFVNVKLSKDFSKRNLDGELLAQDNYTISSSDIRNVYSEKKFISLNDSYYSDYENLRENFSLPSSIDFGFSVVFNNQGDEISTSKEIPDNVEVYSKRKRIEIVRENGGIAFADLIVRVW